jgi:hypothetical protein
MRNIKQGEDETGLRKILDMTRFAGICILLLHFYYLPIHLISIGSTLSNQFAEWGNMLLRKSASFSNCWLKILLNPVIALRSSAILSNILAPHFSIVIFSDMFLPVL